MGVVKVLLTFTGSHDPFSASPQQGEARSGPVLSILAEREFDRVYLFSTPRMREISEATRTEIESRYPQTAVQMLDVPLKDPTNYVGIIPRPSMRLPWRRARRRCTPAG
jgi:hypothetical protein